MNMIHQGSHRISNPRDTAHSQPRSRILRALLFGLLAVAPGACQSPEPPDIDRSVHALDQSILGTAQSFAVLGGSTVTNTGPTIIVGDLGVDPGLAVTGFPPGLVSGGTIHAGDAVALQAQSDTTTAYNTLAGEAPTVDLTSQDLGGMTLTAGVYHFAAAAQLTGTLTLDAEGDPAATFVFQIGSTLTTASNSTVVLLNGATDCNVFWQVGSSATLGTTTAFVGNILALTSITLTTGATVSGRALARNGAVTMDSNDVSNLRCAADTTTARSGSQGGAGSTGDAGTQSSAGVGGASASSGSASGPTSSSAASVGATGSGVGSGSSGSGSGSSGSVSGSSGSGSGSSSSGSGPSGSGSGSSSSGAGSSSSGSGSGGSGSGSSTSGSSSSESSSSGDSSGSAGGCGGAGHSSDKE